MRLWLYLRSALFIGQMYLVMAVMALAWLPVVLTRPDGASRAIRRYCRYVRWSARAICGLASEVRGPVPQGEVLIASKHQSFFDIILLCSVLPAPKFIMKKELLRTPIVGWYATRIGCVPVDRGRKGRAVAQMIEGVNAGRGTRPGQLVIYPQGTRTAPGADLPYKTGAAILYEQLSEPCVPVATNVGVFWPRSGLRRSPGLGVVEFLEPIAPGLDREAFIEELRDRIETRSDALMAEAGWTAPLPPPARDPAP